MKLFYFLFLFLLLFSFNDMFSQLNKVGIPLLESYKPSFLSEENSLVKSFCQGPDGLMYFISNGLVVYDGIEWKKLENTRKLKLLSIINYNNEQLFAGCENDFGFFDRDSIGNLKFNSLKSLLPSDTINLVDVENISSSIDAILFASKNTLIHYTTKTKRIQLFPIPGNNKSVNVFSLNNHFFISKRNGLFFSLENNELKTIISKGKVLQSPVRGIFLNNENEIIVTTFSDGFFKIKNNELVEWDFPSKELFKEKKIFSLTQLQNKNVAISTFESGLIIIDNNGNILKSLSTDQGLLSNIIIKNALYRQGNIWLSSVVGISRIELNTPFTKVDHLQGLGKGFLCFTIATPDSTIYTATSTGLFRLKKGDNNYTQIGKPDIYFSAHVINGNIFVTNVSGIYKVEGDKLKMLVEIYVPKIFKLNNGQFIVVSHGNISKALFEKDKIILKKISSEKNNGTEQLTDHLSNYWNSNGKTIIKYTFNDKLDSVISITTFDSTKGVPVNSKFHLQTIHDRAYLLAENKILKYNYEKNIFEPDPKNILLNSSQTFWQNIKEDTDGSLYITSEKKLEMLYKNGDKYERRYSIFKKILDDFQDAVEILNTNNILLSSDNGFFVYDSKKQGQDTVHFKTIIRKIEAIKDTFNLVLFGGYSEKSNPKQILELPYKNNSLRFSFAGLFFSNPDKIEYSTMLIGENKNWSDWSRNPFKEYTNVQEGNYEFIVRSKNIYGTISISDVIKIKILPPWYRSVFAYIFYVVLLILLIWILTKINTQRLRKDKDKLEKIVHERTIEIREKNEELNQQKEEILAQTEQLTETNKELENKNNQIIDSIEYAKIIQEAILPSNDLFSSLFTDFFVFYKPRNIVSGDFYWLTQKDDFTILAVADCTGHGVPGGFMSMITLTLLNEIVKIQNITCPAKILKELNNGIINTFGKTSNYITSVEDGADMSILCINKNQSTAEMACAGGSAIIIKNNETIEIFDNTHFYIGDALSIGKEFQFKKTVFKIEPGMAIYQYSDGFQDQFGGPDHKKFSNSRFKNLLENNFSKPMSEQNQIIQESYHEWVKHENLQHNETSYSQTDDITVLGIRL